MHLVVLHAGLDILVRESDGLEVVLQVLLLLEDVGSVNFDASLPLIY